MNPFIDQVLSGFDVNLLDFGTKKFLEKRQSFISTKADSELILEFCEISVDTYEALPAHVPGKLNDTHRNILIWKDPREPYSLQYWTQSEFAQLVELLKAGGYDRVMVRTFFTFTAKTGHGRFLRQENNPHADKFEWRRADEFCNRHPEFRDDKAGVINWNTELREDPIYRISSGQTAGQWWSSQLVSYFSMLGVSAIRLGDDSYNSNGSIFEHYGQETMLQAHYDLKAVANAADIKVLSSLGPYWSFDAWDHNQSIDIKKCDSIADWVLTQPLENWTDKYGIMYVHNGEYFNAGSCNLCGLINAAVSPKASFVRGLDSGDIIENWFPPEASAIRESIDALSHFTWTDTGWKPCYEGLYHFWSDCLSKDYYDKQAELKAVLDAHPPEVLHGAVLAVDTAKKPHNYVLGDFAENCAYPIRGSVSLKDWQSVPKENPIVLFLPRLNPGNAELQLGLNSADPFFNETAMTFEEESALKELLTSDRDVILSGGTASQEILDAFGLSLIDSPKAFEPLEFSVGDTNYSWYDHAALSAVDGMAGRPEDFLRNDYLKIESNGADILSTVTDASGNSRLLASETSNAGGARRIFIGAIPENGARDLANLLFDCPLRCDASASFSALSWTDKSGNIIYGIIRYDAWHTEPVDIALPDDFEILFASSATEKSIGPQGILLGALSSSSAS